MSYPRISPKPYLPILLLLATLACLCLPPTRGLSTEFPLRWRWSNPQPHGNNIIDLAYSPNLGLWIAVGDKGQIYSSYDLDLWTPLQSGTSKALRSVTFLGSRIVITGESGTVLYADFEDQILPGSLTPTPNWIEDSVTAGNRVVAVGDNGAVYTSNNGIAWQQQSTPFSDWLRGIAFGGTGFVAVGENGTIATSSTGLSWAKQTSGTTAHLTRVSFANGRYTAVGDDGVVLTSSNGGASWSPILTGAVNDLFTVADLNGTRIVAGDQEVRMQIGNTVWKNELNAADPPPAWTYLSSLAQPNYFVLAGRTGVIAEGYRTNSATPYFWIPSDNSVRHWQFDVTTLDDLYISVGDQSTILTSDNGIDWSLESPPASTTNNVFLGVGGDTNLLITVGNKGALLISHNTLTNTSVTNLVGTNKTVSTFGVVWETIQPPPTPLDLQGVAALNGLYVVSGSQGTLLTSPNGTTWTPQTTPATAFLSGLASFPGGLVACGDDGTLLSSPDGTNWTTRTSGTLNWIYRVRYVNNTLVALGQNGTLLTSTDSLTWTTRNSGVTTWLNDITFLDQTYFIVGTSGTLLTSTNLSSWTSRGTITGKSLYGATTDGNQLITVGVEGVILRSQVIPDLTPITIREYSRVTSTFPATANNFYFFTGQPDQQFSLDYLNPEATNGWQSGAELEFFDSTGTLFYQETLGGNSLPNIEFYRATLLP